MWSAGRRTRCSTLIAGRDVLTADDDGAQFIAIQWQLRLFGAAETDQLKVFQLWIGVNGGAGSESDAISFAYDPANLPTAPPASYGLTVGAENEVGSAGSQIEGPPTQGYRITSAPGAPGGEAALSFTVRGVRRGPGTVVGRLVSPSVRGTTTDAETILVE